MRTFFSILLASCALYACAPLAPTIAQTPVPAPAARVCIVQTKQCFPTFAQAALRVADDQTIELQPGVYPRDVAAIRAHRVRVQVRDGGRAIFDAQGAHAFGKGIVVTQGDGIVLTNLTFRNAKVPSGNGAGVRHEGGDLTIVNCVFEDNEMGVLSGEHASAHIQIIDSIFSGSVRQPMHDPEARRYPAHNIYVGSAERLTVRGVWSHSSHVGHTLKSRARFNDIEASYFSTRETNGSYEAEFPSGGALRFVGNLIEQGAKSENWRMLSIGLEADRLPNRATEGTVLIAQNTFINRYGLFGEMVNVRAGERFKPSVTMFGNVWIGPGELANDVNIAGSLSELIDAAQCDFRLKPIENGKTGAFAPTAQFEYVHPARHRPRTDRSGYGALSADNTSLQRCP